MSHDTFCLRSQEDAGALIGEEVESPVNHRAEYSTET